ncbi:MAG: methyltransferase domain-containing protein [Bacteroidetes bacterium]|jgi:2-polyprenyl-3-methyl-5-hydroxy-6-metoxy-1,4-benzoquinol methylase|nr:methyltransferase domain-containing protein [Bacteroidota bacterium]
MLLKTLKYRTNKSEIMDDFDLKGHELEAVLKDLNNVNKRLGGYKITINGIKKLLPQQNRTFKIADVGCGSGDNLRQIAKWAKRKNISLQLYGVDANLNSINTAKSLSSGFDNIKFLQQNVFDESFNQHQFDVIYLNLTLHHFKNKDIRKLLPILYQNSNLGLVINDLHRHWLAYLLFQLYSSLLMKSKIAKHDGKVSILRGFKKNELENFSTIVKPRNLYLEWCWAFRYLCIFQK